MNIMVFIVCFVWDDRKKFCLLILFSGYVINLNKVIKFKIIG